MEKTPAPDTDDAKVRAEHADRAERDLRYLSEMFERLGDRYLDEIRGFDGLNGALLGAIFAFFLLVLDRVATLTWWPVVALVPAAILTIRSFRGRVAFSPDPAIFGPLFARDPVDAVRHLIQNRQRDIVQNAALRNRKRSDFRQALALLIGAALVAGVFAAYNQLRSLR